MNRFILIFRIGISGFIYGLLCVIGFLGIIALIYASI